MVLKRIVEDKRVEVDAFKKTVDPDLLWDLPLSDRCLETALRLPHTGFIMECKKASPSKGLIRAEFDPVQIAGKYKVYADAISVLTDKKYFQGDLNFLTAVRAAVDVPVLCKDFILEPFQIRLARAHGADAVLLMLSVLDDAQFEVCFEAATALGMNALVEVRDAEEMERARNLGAKIIGINNRNLDNLKVDLNATTKLSEFAPKNAVVISESGIQTHSDVVALRHHANAFLVGTSLMQKDDISKAARELVFGRVKVCGLTCVEDATAAKRSGAVYGGVIFAENSKRRVSTEVARKICAATDLDMVGVFVNSEIEFVGDTAKALGLAAVQLHGSESAGYVLELKKRLPKTVEIWKAVHVTNEEPALTFEGADKVLLDTASGSGSGGTGRRFDWSLIKTKDLSRVIVAGGLGLENAVEADQLGGYALDVNSGVEDAPGKKSEQKLKQFFALLRGKGRS